MQTATKAVAEETRNDRRKTTGEVFTPMELCLQMVREIPEEKLSDPTTTYLDNSCGNGNFLIAILQVLTEEHGIPAVSVINNQLFGVDLMPDNIAECRERLGLTSRDPGWRHIVCHDALTYDYSFQ